MQEYLHLSSHREIVKIRYEKSSKVILSTNITRYAEHRDGKIQPRGFTSLMPPTGAKRLDHVAALEEVADDFNC